MVAASQLADAGWLHCIPAKVIAPTGGTATRTPVNAARLQTPHIVGHRKLRRLPVAGLRVRARNSRSRRKLSTRSGAPLGDPLPLPPPDGHPSQDTGQLGNKQHGHPEGKSVPSPRSVLSIPLHRTSVGFVCHKAPPCRYKADITPTTRAVPSIAGPAPALLATPGPFPSRGPWP